MALGADDDLSEWLRLTPEARLEWVGECVLDGLRLEGKRDVPRLRRRRKATAIAIPQPSMTMSHHAIQSRVVGHDVRSVASASSGALGFEKRIACDRAPLGNLMMGLICWGRAPSLRNAPDSPRSRELGIGVGNPRL